MKKATFILNLDSPMSVRYWLDGLYLEGKKITEITNAAGETIQFDKMTDAQILNYGRRLSNWFTSVGAKYK